MTVELCKLVDLAMCSYVPSVYIRYINPHHTSTEGRSPHYLAGGGDPVWSVGERSDDVLLGTWLTKLPKYTSQDLRSPPCVPHTGRSRSDSVTVPLPTSPALLRPARPLIVMSPAAYY